MSQVRALHDSLIVLFLSFIRIRRPSQSKRKENPMGRKDIHVMCLRVFENDADATGRAATRRPMSRFFEWAVRTESSPFSSVLFGEATLDSIRHSSHPPRGRRRPNRIVHSLALLFLRRRALSRGRRGLFLRIGGDRRLRWAELRAV